MRKFRVKFAQTGTATALETCSDFVSNISSHILIKEITDTTETDSQAQQEGNSQSILASDSQSFKSVAALDNGRSKVTFQSQSVNRARGQSSAYEPQSVTIGEIGQQVCIVRDSFEESGKERM